MRLNQIGTEHSPHGTTRKTKMHDPRSWRCPWGSFLFSKPSISLVPWRNSRTMKTKTWCYGHDHIISRGKIVPQYSIHVDKVIQYNLTMGYYMVMLVTHGEGGAQQWARFRLNPNRTVTPWFNGLLVPKKFNVLVWIFDKRFSFGSKTRVCRFGSKVYRFLVNCFFYLNSLLI